MSEWMKRYAADEEEFRRECWWASAALNEIYEKCEPGWRFESALARDENWEIAVITFYNILDRKEQRVFTCNYNNGEPIISEPSARRQ